MAATADEQSFIPAFFPAMLQEQHGEEVARRILDGSAQQRRVTLRANTILSGRDEVARSLDEAGISWSSVPWYEDAFVIDQGRERSIWDLDLYAQGKVYLQSLSSMMPALVMDPKPGLDILDMCAAPGGKTTQLVALGGPGCHVTACERSAVRCEKLQFNLQRQGAGNVTLLKEDARRLSEFFRFDRILLDAPCSGSGTLKAGDPRTAERFTEQLIANSVKSQKALLSKALSLLKPGGRLVYSTCSVLRQENEDVVTACLKSAAKLGSFKVEAIDPARFDGAPLLPTTLEGALCVCPTELYEGFFMCHILKER